MSEEGNVQEIGLKGHLIGYFSTIIGGLILGAAAPFFTFVDLNAPFIIIISNGFLWIAILLELIGSFVNAVAFSYVRAVIVAAVGGSIQIAEGVILGFILRNEPFRIFYVISVSLIIFATLLIGFDLARKTVEEEAVDLLPQNPYFKITDATIQNGFMEIYKVLNNNLNAPMGKIKHRWAMPSGIFMSAYLWDSAFISQIWKYWDSNIAGEILMPLFDSQSEDGRIPHFTNFLTTSKLTQPPILAWAISRLDLPIDYLKQVYPALKKYNEWLYDNRQLQNGLFHWGKLYESGMDNSPRFTNTSEKITKDLTRIAAVDINSYIVMQNSALKKIARSLSIYDTYHDYKSDIIEFEEKKEKLISLIQNYLWDEEFGLYFDYDVVNERRIEVNTIASFLPLTAGIPDEHQTSRLLKHLESPHEYNTKIPLPTVARNDHEFQKDMWRGPVWINTAYLIIKGLEDRKLFKLSSEFSYKLIKGVFKTWQNEGSFYEFYDPDRYDLKELSRKKGNLYKRITLGKKPVKKFVGWTGLVNSLLIESVIGYDKISKTLQPRFTEEWKGKIFELGFPAEDFVIECSYSNEKDILIKLTDSKNKKEDFIVKCSLYQEISLERFFS